MQDHKAFFNKFRVEEYFKRSELDWETLDRIYDDYVMREKSLNLTCDHLETKIIKLLKNAGIHSIRARVKDKDHLIEKIIRKRGKDFSDKYKDINVSNYMDVVRDTVGVRILVLSKENWEAVYDVMKKEFSSDGVNCECRMVEPPVAYTRYGDRDIFKNKIRTEHSNKGYRSQHYIVKYEGVYCEIQVRTLAEEVYGEFDHVVKYPYRENNKFLVRYANTMSQLTDAVDELISTCLQLKGDGWKQCDSSFQEDKYIDWKNISKSAKEIGDNEEKKQPEQFAVDRNVKENIKNIIFRKKDEYDV